MSGFLIHYMAPIMFAALVVFLLLGYPVAFSLAANGLMFALIGIELGLIIPPSLVLIVMADQLGRSVGEMYEGAFIPGLTLAGLYAVYVLLVTIFYPNAAPGLPKEAVGFLEDKGQRGLTSLALLTVASGAVGWFAMRNSTIRGADYVVLTMFIGIVFAFLVAVVSWGSDRAFGMRFL